MKSNEERVLKTTTPTARKEHVCAVCGKPIQKGERYLNVSVLENGKVKSRKTHFGCSEPKKTNTPPNSTKLSKGVIGGSLALSSLYMPPVPEVISEKHGFLGGPVPQTEEQFKKQVHDDTLDMLKTFTFRENMDIAFTPLIITEWAWHYAFETMKLAAEYRIEVTKKLGRTVKMLRQNYLDTCKKDLDRNHLQKMIDEAERMRGIMAKDLLILYFSVNNDLKRGWSELAYLDLRTNAYISIVMIEFLYQHNQRMNKIIEEKMGSAQEYKNPITDSLKTCMEAYVSPCEIDFSQHVKTSMAILQKHINKIEWNVV